MGRKLKKALGVATLAVAAGWASAVLAQDLLNPSFEDPETAVTNPWKDLAAHWGRWGNWMNRESAWIPTHSGSGMIGYHHWQIEENSSSGIFQDLTNTAANVNYTFSVYAFKDTGTNLEYVELRIEKLSGKDVIASKVYWRDELESATWQELTVSGMNTEPGLRVLIIVKPKASGLRQGCIKFDDASLQVQG
jgi:hypothetical protein